MRSAVITTLQALYDGKEVTAGKSLQCNTTRITNEISTLRNDFGVDIITDKVITEGRSWFGSYRLIRSEANLKKVREILAIYSTSNEANKGKD